MAHAGVIPYSDPAGQGTQDFGGNLALTFNVLSPITVVDIGVFNAAGNGNISGSISVAIYNTGTDTMVTPVVTFSGAYTPVGFDVFQAIAPVVLGAGSYEIDAVGFSAADLNGNLNTGSSTGPILNNDGGALSFTGAAYDGSVTLDGPATCPTCQAPPAPVFAIRCGRLRDRQCGSRAEFLLGSRGRSGWPSIRCPPPQTGVGSRSSVAGPRKKQ
jgi:hypothetical protein